MTRNKRLRFAAAIAACAALVLTGCSESAEAAQSGPGQENPWQIAGATSSTGPSGPRPDAPDAPIQAENGDGGQMDQLALNAVYDVQEFWKNEYSKTFPGTFKPVEQLISWDALAPKSEAVEFCTVDTYQMVNAAYCSTDHSIGWDRGVLLPELVKEFGDMSVVMVLAHEYGHALQFQAKIADRRTPGLVREQQADCLAGVYLRYVAEGDSKYFTMNTTDGLNGVLGATVAVRDRDPDDPDNVHGSAFERVTAVQMGYTSGAEACKAINEDEIEQRRAGLPITFEDDHGERQLPVDQESLVSVANAAAKALPSDSAPQYDYSGVASSCSGVTVTEPVSYCPDANTIGTDIPALAERAGPLEDEDKPLSAIVSGDYNAYVVFISRYTLAVQKARGLSLEGADTAGLRTSCLSGAITTELSKPGSEVQLSAGDLDEAISGLLSDGLAASDVNGKTVDSGYLRLEAFRLGVLEGEAACANKYN
ncbi:metallopeptidase [Nocardia cyriacigeorgica]|uniref:Metallopeptidase n=1 Tax=Nocardia cyriacigeorgica TaxID=135487 RepID=A0A5R8PE06_9NOCA|nr:metallopeptidase [Nocardia cyriacigeorgica]TLG10895.1 metallopeptidase [Nocardia cyriacigeorgica]